MSEPTLDELVHILQNDPSPNHRAEAARRLGEAAPSLGVEDRKTLVHILNEALKDPDPQVLMAAMTALSGVPSDPDPLDEMEDAEPDAAVEAAACRVCGRPEALVSPDECEYDNCPYR